MYDIPIGRDDIGRSAVWVLYREWLYRRKIAENPLQKRVKTMKNVKFELNRLFCGAFWSKLDSYGVKKYAGEGYEVGFKQNNWFGVVLKHFDFSRNPEFSAYFSYLSM